jgi:hypothetical protein
MSLPPEMNEKVGEHMQWDNTNKLMMQLKNNMHIMMNKKTLESLRDESDPIHNQGKRKGAAGHLGSLSHHHTTVK